MVVQSGDGSTGGKDTKPVKTPAPWKYLLIAAVLAASILGIFFAATSGIFSNSDPAIDASASQIYGASQPAINSGLVLADEEDEKKITKATKIPNPNEIMPYKTIIDISNIPKFIQTYKHKEGLIITDIEINDDKITAAYLNINQERSIRVRPVLIYFLAAKQNHIWREQWVCIYGSGIQYRMANAQCQWPNNYCDTKRLELLWEEYWEKRIGESMKTETVGSTIFKDIVPTIKPGTKYKFSVECVKPEETKYIEII
ncbi:hypothetical protein C5S31_12100 [ANME-1 cluster archaeon GoMg2]|nr:hypothetical protein [ANME-1 cluster archaeon GoMg2]